MSSDQSDSGVVVRGQDDPMPCWNWVLVCLTDRLERSPTSHCRLARPSQEEEDRQIRRRLGPSFRAWVYMTHCCARVLVTRRFVPSQTSPGRP